MSDSDERRQRILARVWEVARNEGLVGPSQDDPNKETINVEREWILQELKKADQLEP
jgi:hypothetical protein